MKSWANKFHNTRRRLKQGLLERVGAAETSGDVKRDERQWSRYAALESSLHAVNDALRQHLESLMVSCAPELRHKRCGGVAGITGGGCLGHRRAVHARARRVWTCQADKATRGPRATACS